MVATRSGLVGQIKRTAGRLNLPTYQELSSDSSIKLAPNFTGSSHLSTTPIASSVEPFPGGGEVPSEYDRNLFLSHEHYCSFVLNYSKRAISQGHLIDFEFFGDHPELIWLERFQAESWEGLISLNEKVYPDPCAQFYANLSFKESWNAPFHKIGFHSKVGVGIDVDLALSRTLFQLNDGGIRVLPNLESINGASFMDVLTDIYKPSTAFDAKALSLANCLNFQEKLMQFFFVKLLHPYVGSLNAVSRYTAMCVYAAKHCIQVEGASMFIDTIAESCFHRSSAALMHGMALTVILTSTFLGGTFCMGSIGCLDKRRLPRPKFIKVKKLAFGIGAASPL